jgi:outer membrane protein assembly factor BamD (BamD/ComL family)
MGKIKQLSLLIMLLGALSLGVGAQSTPESSSESAVVANPILESDAKHNFEVAKWSFDARKAYKAVLLRFDETYAAYPIFSRMDEFYFIAAMSSINLLEGKGSQRLDYSRMSEEEKERFAPARLREDAILFLKTIVEKYPKSRHFKDADRTLSSLIK